MKLLFLYPQDICYGIVSSMMENLSLALENVGVQIVSFDPKVEDPNNLANIYSDDYNAVVDFYSGLLSIGGGNGGYFFDLFNCPIYQLDLDYPIYILEQLDIPLKNHFILCGNDRYIPVIKESMPHIKDAFFFPMTGIETKSPVNWKDRKYQVTFMGTYNDYREYLKGLDSVDDEIRTIALTLFNVMKDDVSLDQTDAMEKTLSVLGIELDRREMYQWFQMIGQMAMAAFAYHRERVVDTILKGGLFLTVFGDSWKASPFFGNSNLNILPAVDEDGYVNAMSETKVSINVMYGNRSGFTERYGYSMLNGAVCLSEKSDYIERHFQDKEEILYYDLSTLEDLVDKIKLALTDEEMSCRISEKAKEKALKEHTWEKRAERFLELLL